MIIKAKAENSRPIHSFFETQLRCETKTESKPNNIRLRFMNEKTQGIKREFVSRETNKQTYIHTENNKTDLEIIDKWVLRRT